MRLRGITGIILFALSLRVHHHFRGPPLDYDALAVAAAASWVGVPGPGEPVLIAGGVFAAQHRLDIVSVLLVAWAGATAGGVAGWLVGIKLGRAVLLAPGPLLRVRENAVERGERIFGRVPVLAVLLTPSWVAGTLRVRPRIYLPVNAISAAAWAAGIGLGAYFIGPAVIEFVNDLGWVLGSALVLLIVIALGGGVRQRRRAKDRRRTGA